jgi:galactofuranose transport system permease protein
MTNKAKAALGIPEGGGGLARLRRIVRGYGALIALLLLVLYNVLLNPTFLTAQAISVNLTQVATIVIVGVGMTLVIATGGIDLSVGALMAISGALCALIFLSPAFAANRPLGNFIGVLAALLATTLCGLFNGTLVTRFQIQPIIATLVLFIAGRGIAQVLTNGNLQVFENQPMQYIGLGRPLGLPFQVILMLLIVAVVAWVTRVTTFGRYILAIGGNEQAARLAGVPVTRVKLAVYAISGFLAGIAGLIVIAINSASDANLVGLNMELDAIAAVAVGGTPLTGGRAMVLGTLVGALIIQLIKFTLVSNNVPFAAAQIINAAIILTAVYVQRKG